MTYTFKYYHGIRARPVLVLLSSLLTFDYTSPPLSIEITRDFDNSSDLPPNFFINELTTKMADVLTKTLAHTIEPYVISIGIKLKDTNYGLQSQVIEMYISGKDKLGYINGDFP